MEKLIFDIEMMAGEHTAFCGVMHNWYFCVALYVIV
jgi:hypothetical protein